MHMTQHLSISDALHESLVPKIKLQKEFKTYQRLNKEFKTLLILY